MNSAEFILQKNKSFIDFKIYAQEQITQGILKIRFKEK